MRQSCSPSLPVSERGKYQSGRGHSAPPARPLQPHHSWRSPSPRVGLWAFLLQPSALSGGKKGEGSPGAPLQSDPERVWKGGGAPGHKPPALHIRNALPDRLRHAHHAGKPLEALDLNLSASSCQHLERYSPHLPRPPLRHGRCATRHNKPVYPRDPHARHELTSAGPRHIGTDPAKAPPAQSPEPVTSPPGSPPQTRFHTRPKPAYCPVQGVSAAKREGRSSLATWRACCLLFDRVLPRHQIYRNSACQKPVQTERCRDDKTADTSRVGKLLR